MIRFVLAGVAVAALASPAAAQYYGTGSNYRSNSVNGHFRDNGTYVQPHYRTNPDSSSSNNYGAYGNYNPYTGKTGRGY